MVRTPEEDTGRGQESLIALKTLGKITWEAVVLSPGQLGAARFSAESEKVVHCLAEHQMKKWAIP